MDNIDKIIESIKVQVKEVKDNQVLLLKVPLNYYDLMSVDTLKLIMNCLKEVYKTNSILVVCDNIELNYMSDKAKLIQRLEEQLDYLRNYDDNK